MCNDISKTQDIMKHAGTLHVIYLLLPQNMSLGYDVFLFSIGKTCIQMLIKSIAWILQNVYDTSKRICIFHAAQTAIVNSATINVNRSRYFYKRMRTTLVC